MVRTAVAAVAIVAIGACYTATPPAGAPCDDTNPCPTGQSCVAGRCAGQRPMTDAPEGDGTMLDMGMPTPTDLDGDGIPNTSDNCPNYANANQGNEDGDPLGDPCDPCPIDPASPPVDPDNDMVSDSCDPRPTMPGDMITLFEGFHAGVPATWQVIGTSAPAGDDVTLSSADRGALVPPSNGPTNGYVSLKARITQTVGNADSALAAVLPYNPSTDNGIFCELYAPDAGSQQGRELDLWDAVAQQSRGTQGYNWQLNTVYTLTMRKTGNAYTCQATPMGGAMVQTTGSTGSNPGMSKAAVFIYGMNVSVQWMLIVASP
jgi:hypothetical protein